MISKKNDIKYKTKLLKKDLISLKDLKRQEICDLLKLIKFIKNERHLSIEKKDYKPKYDSVLRGINPLSLFNYPSIRTIGSYHIALNELGANQNLNLNMNDTPYSYSNEKFSHTAKVLNACSYQPWFDLLYVRFHGEDSDVMLSEFVKNSSAPVINAMSQNDHPLQGLTDIFTILEEWDLNPGYHLGKKVTWFGSGNNNTTMSAMLSCSAVGIDFTLITPKEKKFQPLDDVLDKANLFANESGSKIEIVNDPNNIRYTKGTDVVITDTHSLGVSDEEKYYSRKILAQYRLDSEKTYNFNDNWIFLHCMPIHTDKKRQ